MHRAALLLCALVGLAGGLMAAPAPFPRSGPWVTGWDKPIGHGCFQRKGDILTITIPENVYSDCAEGRLLRDVEGDFALQVRLGVDFTLPDEDRGFRVAGIIVVGNKSDWVTVVRNAWDVSSSYSQGDSSLHVPSEGGQLTRLTYLWLERKGDRVRTAFGRDGKVWTAVGEAQTITLPRKVKVGVVIEAKSKGTLQVVFDRWKLTPLSRRGR